MNNPDLLFNALLMFFIAAPIFEGAVTFLLLRALRAGNGHRNPALLERFLGSGALLAASIILSFLAINRLFVLHFPDNLAVFMFMAVLILVGVPAIIWLLMYSTGRFDQ